MRWADGYSTENKVNSDDWKIEKNPEFSSKIGVRNTSEFVSSKQKNEWFKS